jgi:hypothetical protein
MKRRYTPLFGSNISVHVNVMGLKASGSSALSPQWLF